MVTRKSFRLVLKSLKSKKPTKVGKVASVCVVCLTKTGNRCANLTLFDNHRQFLTGIFMTMYMLLSDSLYMMIVNKITSLGNLQG